MESRLTTCWRSLTASGAIVVNQALWFAEKIDANFRNGPVFTHGDKTLDMSTFDMTVRHDGIIILQASVNGIIYFEIEVVHMYALVYENNVPVGFRAHYYKTLFTQEFYTALGFSQTHTTNNVEVQFLFEDGGSKEMYDQCKQDLPMRPVETMLFSKKSTPHRKLSEWRRTDGVRAGIHANHVHYHLSRCCRHRCESEHRIFRIVWRLQHLLKEEHRRAAYWIQQPGLSYEPGIFTHHFTRLEDAKEDIPFANWERWRQIRLLGVSVEPQFKLLVRMFG